MLSNLDIEIRKKISSRVLVITKSADPEMIYDIKEALREVFEDFNDEEQMVDLGNSFDGPTYESTCRDILEQLRSQIRAHADLY